MFLIRLQWVKKSGKVSKKEVLLYCNKKYQDKTYSNVCRNCVIYYRDIMLVLYPGIQKKNVLKKASESPRLNHCAAFYISPPVCVSARGATELWFIRLFLLLLSLVSATHLPTQAGSPLVQRTVRHGTSVRLAAFDWPPCLSFSSSSRRWVGAAVSPVWHVPSQILHGVKFDTPLFLRNQNYPPFNSPQRLLRFPLSTRLRISTGHIRRWRWRAGCRGRL